jgi:hypothetical protein
LVFFVNGTAAGTGNSPVFGDYSRTILIKMALVAVCIGPISYFMIRE